MSPETTQLDYKRPHPALRAGIMVTYRKPYTNHGARCWRPVAAMVVALRPTTAKVRIGGHKGLRYCYKEIWVQRQNLYPAVPMVEGYLAEFQAGEVVR